MPLRICRAKSLQRIYACIVISITHIPKVGGAHISTQTRAHIRQPAEPPPLEYHVNLSPLSLVCGLFPQSAPIRIRAHSYTRHHHIYVCSEIIDCTRRARYFLFCDSACVSTPYVWVPPVCVVGQTHGRPASAARPHIHKSIEQIVGYTRTLLTHTNTIQRTR